MSAEEQLVPEQSNLPEGKEDETLKGEETQCTIQDTSKPAGIEGKVENGATAGGVTPDEVKDKPLVDEQVEKMPQKEILPEERDAFRDEDASGDEDIPGDGDRVGNVEADFVLVEDAEGGHEDSKDLGAQGLEEEPMDEGEEYHEEGSDGDMQEGSHHGGDEHGDDFHSGEDDVGSECYDEAEDGNEPGEEISDNLQSMVSQVLDKKMEGFQAQMQQMFTMIQNVAGKSAPKQGNQDAEQEAKSKFKPMEEPSGSQREGNPPVKLETPEQKQFKQFLVTVCGVLGMPGWTVQKEKSVLDNTVNVDETPVMENLPVEGMVKNSWQKVEGKYLNEVSRPLQFADYPWSTEDMDAFGEIPVVNQDMNHHLKRKKYRSGTSKQLAIKFEPEMKKMEKIFRHQQRILSYASYFLAALGKSSKTEGESSQSSEIMKYLSKCLIDICDMSVRGCIVVTKSRRRMYLDAMDVTTTNSHYLLINKPLAKQLFPPDLESTFGEHGIEFFSTPPGGPKFAGVQLSNSERQAAPRFKTTAAQMRQSVKKSNQAKKNTQTEKKGRQQAQGGNQAQRGKRGQRDNQGRGIPRGQGSTQGQENRQGQASWRQGNPRGGPRTQQASSNKRSRPRSPESSQPRGSAERNRERGSQGRTSADRRRSSAGREGGERDAKRRRPLSDFRTESRPRAIPSDIRSPPGLSSASINVGRLTGRSSLYGYDSILSGSGRSSSLYSTSYPLPATLGGGGHYRPGMSPSVLASLAPLDSKSEGFQGSDDDGLF